MRRDDIPVLIPLPPLDDGVRQVLSHRFPAGGAAVIAEYSWVVEEQALFIDVAEVGLYTVMWTRTEGGAERAAGFLPGDGVLDDCLHGDAPAPEALALCAGFLLTESMIDSMLDIASMAICPDSPDVVRVRLVDPARVRSKRRGGFVASSCGICGGIDQVGKLEDGLARVSDTLRIDAAGFAVLMEAMQAQQRVFNATGGTHAAALFTSSAKLLAKAEDLGRHNALDKVIGQCLLREQTSAGCGALLSGRVSLEMIIKAARAGIEIVASVSAPSSLAIDAAHQLGITLCSFVRQGRLTAFTHPHRLTKTETAMS